MIVPDTRGVPTTYKKDETHQPCISHFPCETGVQLVQPRGVGTERLAQTRLPRWQVVSNATRGDIAFCEQGTSEIIERVDPRCLVVFAARQHDDVGRRSLGGYGTAVCILAARSLLEKGHDIVGNTAKVALAV